MPDIISVFHHLCCCQVSSDQWRIDVLVQLCEQVATSPVYLTDYYLGWISIIVYRCALPQELGVPGEAHRVTRGRELAHIVALCERAGAPPPGPDATHISVRLGPSLRFKWERHGEFSLSLRNPQDVAKTDESQTTLGAEGVEQRALDQEARKRGNSVYLPDRVVPMLPEAISNDLCSLRPHEDRAAMVAEIQIDKDGKRQSHHIERALIRSHARLTYDQGQAVFDGVMDEADCDVPHGCLHALFGAWRAKADANLGHTP